MNRLEFDMLNEVPRHGLVRAFLVILLCTWLPIVLIGCHGGTPSSVVEGKITYRNKSVTRGLINFVPEKGRPLGGPIHSDGTYRFKLPPGSYRVTIMASPELPEGWEEGDPVPKQRALVPARYSQPNSSRLHLVVPDGSEPLVKNFDLK